MKKIILAALLSTFCMSSAFAANVSKAYVAADIGAATYSGAGSYPSNTRIMRLAGGYNFNSSVAIEVGYTKFSDVVLSDSTVNTTLSASSIQVAAVGSYPLSNQFDITAKLGAAANSVKEVGGTPSGSSWWNNLYTKTSLMYGVGAQYRMTSQFGLRAQYESFGDMTGTSPAITASAMSAGIVYNF